MATRRKDLDGVSDMLDKVKNPPPLQGDTIRNKVVNRYNTGDMLSEDDLENMFKRKGNNPKNFPQLSVQDYSTVKEDDKGKYVVKTDEDTDNSK